MMSKAGSRRVKALTTHCKAYATKIFVSFRCHAQFRVAGDCPCKRAVYCCASEGRDGDTDKREKRKDKNKKTMANDRGANDEGLRKLGGDDEITNKKMEGWDGVEWDGKERKKEGNGTKWND